jgi:hypothetical protein
LVILLDSRHELRCVLVIEGLGNKSPTKNKITQLIGIVLLYLEGLNDSKYITGKKRALTAHRIRQRDWLCQMRGSIGGNQGES